MEKIYFFDISKLGKDPYGNKDIGIVTNAQAVLESVYNILLTEPGQHPMDPELGTPLSKYLFEPIDYVTAGMIDAPSDIDILNKDHVLCTLDEGAQVRMEFTVIFISYVQNNLMNFVAR